MYATQKLRDDHESILELLSVLECVGERLQANKPADLDHLAQILDFLTIFADRCHHGKEEDLLFVALEKAGIPKEGGPIGIMLAEHTEGRGYIREMTDALAKMRNGELGAGVSFGTAALEYAFLLRSHIDKENSVLFMIAEQHLPAEEHARLAAGFAQIEGERMADGGREKYYAMLHNLCDIYLK